MLKLLNMALIVCPIGFSEAIVADFCMKRSQVDTENDKNLKIFQLSKISFVFPQVFDGLFGLER